MDYLAGGGRETDHIQSGTEMVSGTDTFEL